MTFEEFLTHLHGVKGSGTQRTALCPAHGDKKQSLSVSVGDNGGIVLHCHAGCSTEDIVWAMGLQMQDLFPEVRPGDVFRPQQSPPATQGKPTVVATYDFRDSAGGLLAQKLRKSDKSFSWRRPDGKGGWLWNRKGVPHCLYVAGKLEGAVFVAEGEKDAYNLHSLGYNAASGADGAGPGKWRKEYSEQLQGLHVCVFQDNDPVGKDYAVETCNALHGVAASVRLLDLSKVWPEIPEHGDVTDMIVQLGPAKATEHIAALVAGTAEWEPVEQESRGPAAKIVCMADIEAKKTKWLWYPYVPLGKITLMQGDPGGSKTTLSLAIASIISKGGRFINDDELSYRAPAKVLYQTAEDGIDDTIKPRLMKMEPDFTNIFLIDEREEGLTLSDARIEDAFKRLHPSLAIIDPLQAYLGADVDMHRANEVRPVMAKIGRLAEEYQCAVLFIMHMSKMTQQKALYRGLGSIDFAAVARSVLVVGRNPMNDQEIIMAHEKSSLAKNGQSIVYHIDNEKGIVFDGFSELTADDILGPKQTLKGRPGDMLEEAKALLYDKMGEEGFARRDDIISAALGQGITERTVQRAKKEIGIWHLALGRASSRDTWWLMPGVEKDALPDGQKK